MGLSLTQAVLGALVAPVLANNKPTCRSLPSDASWPSADKWKALNSTIHGNLIRTLPTGHVCHDPTYDAAACAKVQAEWQNPTYKATLPEAVMTPSFSGDACDPFAPREQPCDIGGLAQYIVKVTCPEDAAAGLKFAHDNNVRLVVKNTGHDFLGRSSGYGSMALWTHNLKSKTFFRNYKSKSYTGPAVKVGAGVQVLEAYEFVSKHGHMMVGGECPSVGLAGGYTAGGGQSPLSSYAGLAADQTLEFEAVTADGRVVRAAPDENEDLYWAMSGGGPGYAVVLCVTYRVFPDTPVVATNITFSKNDAKGGQDGFWKALDYWHRFAPAITDFGGYTYTDYTNTTFEAVPLFAPNKTTAQNEALLAPFRDQLISAGVDYQFNVATYTGFLDAYKAWFNWDIGGVQDGHLASRLIPRSVLQNHPGDLQHALKQMLNTGAAVQEMTIGAKSSIASNTDNAVNPAWRDADVFVIFGDPDPTHLAAQVNNQVTHVWADLLRKAAPDSGTYMNEADWDEVNWQQSFYGSKYDRLLRIKHKYDPSGVFYAVTAVGSEEWKVNGDGRLCKA